MKKHFSLHKIAHAHEFSFSPAAYSRFKFGDDLVAENFGKALAIAFISECGNEINLRKQLVVLSSPYAFIPTASFSMKNYFVIHLNRYLAENHYPVVQEAKVYRSVTYREDYGELDAQQRINLIGNDSFHIDQSFLEDKILIFLDDIKITGGHERMITKMLQQYNVTNQTWLLYFAELINSDIHPNIENYLNYFSVKSLFDLDDIINEGRFAINTRIVKYILNTDAGIFDIFIQNKSQWFIEQLYDMAIGNGYHLIDAYTVNLSSVKKMLGRQTVITV